MAPPQEGPPQEGPPPGGPAQERPLPSGLPLGHPRVHLRTVASTNDHARTLAIAGAPHGTLVTAHEQTAGRGRQGRRWSAPAGRALVLSLILREVPPLLPLAAGVAVAEVTGGLVKWPNDVLLDGRKVAGILAEGRPQAGWAVLGVGINVAVDPATLPSDVADRAATLGRAPEEVEDVLAELLAALARAFALTPVALLAALRDRDALRGRAVAWADGEGTADGIDGGGGLRVRTAGGGLIVLDAGEVHLR